MGLTAGSLSELVGTECCGLLGADVLNDFHLIIDVNHGSVTVSSSQLDVARQSIAFRQFMGIPIIWCKHSRCSITRFFRYRCEDLVLPTTRPCPLPVRRHGGRLLPRFRYLYRSRPHSFDFNRRISGGIGMREAAGLARHDAADGWHDRNYRKRNLA